MLNSAHQGYYYQDILGAYLVAQEIAEGGRKTAFHFDHKKTNEGVTDKFDDLAIYKENETIYIQVKYSNEKHQHSLTKKDFSSKSSNDLALFDLFETWKSLNKDGVSWRVCLAWDKPIPNDPIRDVLIEVPENNSFLPQTTCYRFSCNILWPEGKEVLPSWRALRQRSKSIDRSEFKSFLNSLIIEVGYPKSTLLQDYTQGLERLLIRAIENIGIGVYPNDHLSAIQVSEGLCNFTRRSRSEKNSTPITSDEIAQSLNIIQDFGGIEQQFPIDKNVLVSTPDRVDQIEKALSKNSTVILTAEPGAGKSWFIENLESSLKDTTNIIKHYCYIALEDPLSINRITVNVLYGSLITQILQSDEELGHHMTKRYASNLEQLNILLGKINRKTLLIVDGIDHIWRIYQKNRGGLTEDATTIIEALLRIDCTNPKVSLLVISQPIEQFESFTTFHHCTLASLTEEFVKKLLEKNAIPNNLNREVSLSQVIYDKSNGNALYCKYLIDHATQNKSYKSFDWINSLPPYEFNLTGYYNYLHEQINRESGVPYTLCGAGFSLKEKELREITHLGDLVSKQLSCLRPILKYNPTLGYAIYHESFKRYLIDCIKEQGASIDYLIYRPLIEWLEKHSFFESTKAYSHLLKLYFEVDNYDAISQTISSDFIDNSLFHAQPLNSIKQNHLLQKTALLNIDRFAPMIIVAEQSKIFNELENITDKVFTNYLKAVQKIHGEEVMYRVLWDGENLLVSTEDAFSFLVELAYQGNSIIHWSILPELKNISYDLLGFNAIKLIHTKEFQELDRMIKKINENPNHKEALKIIIDELEWWNIQFGVEWIDNTPYLKNLLNDSKNSAFTLEEAVNRIISNDRFVYDDTWKAMILNLIAAAKTNNYDDKAAIIKNLSNYNWFRNWLIYLIKISELSERKHNEEELIEAFSYLVRNLKPFEGEPRACDLYSQIPFIRRSFHLGLLLCKNNEELLIQCCELLEKVTSITTSLQGSFSGPLTDEAFLKLISSYLPTDYVLSKYEEYYAPLGSRRVYSEVAKIAFEYSYLLYNSNEDKKAKLKYIEGIQALTSYGYRKDRTLSEVLDSSVPFQHTYNTLGVEWFYDLYQMAMTVVTHTDGKSTSRYPIEWFEEFIKVYPEDALKFLACETLESSKANWHQENEFHHLLQEHATLFSPTNWFLLCRSLPFASSEKIISHGLEIIDQIDEPLKEIYKSWLRSLPFAVAVKEGSTYSGKLVTQFERKLGVTIESKEELESAEEFSNTESVSSPSMFPTSSLEEALVFLDTKTPNNSHSTNIYQLVNSLQDWEKKKSLLLQISKSLGYKRKTAEWLDNLFDVASSEWLYLNVCIFVFSSDGWYSGLHSTHYLKRSYEQNNEETIKFLKELLGQFLLDNRYFGKFSCNLIIALSEIQFNEPTVTDLLQTIFQLVKRRLPHPPSAEINESMTNGLIGFSQNEITVALLIARLKTLTTEKTQGIIWSLVYVAQNRPEDLFKAYNWAFSHPSHLLSVHRAILLQILKDYVDQTIIPDELIAKLIINYPTGFFLEDQFIRSFVDYNLDLDENSAKSISLENHRYDASFFSYIHLKYRKLFKLFGPLNGTFKAYEFKRDKINKDYNSYYINSERIVTPIVCLANASYEIINGQFYKQLKELTNIFHASETFNLEFYLSEMVLKIGSIGRRPSYLPLPEKFPIFEIDKIDTPLKDKNWIVLASKEKEFYGESFKKKDTRYSSRTLTFVENPKHDGEFYGQFLFRAGQYMHNEIIDAPYDQPICNLNINDTLEYSNILYVSPWIIRDLGLTIYNNFQNGFQAYNKEGEIIITMISWKEDYFGSIDDGTEVPRLEGVAVLIKESYYNRLLALYDVSGWFVLRQNEEDR